MNFVLYSFLYNEIEASQNKHSFVVRSGLCIEMNQKIFLLMNNFVSYAKWGRNNKL